MATLAHQPLTYNQGDLDLQHVGRELTNVIFADPEVKVIELWPFLIQFRLTSSWSNLSNRAILWACGCKLGLTFCKLASNCLWHGAHKMYAVFTPVVQIAAWRFRETHHLTLFKQIETILLLFTVSQLCLTSVWITKCIVCFSKPPCVLLNNFEFASRTPTASENCWFRGVH